MSTTTDDQEPRFKAGDRVEHTIFGKGTVKEWKPHRGEPSNGAIVIKFDDYDETKELMTAFAGDRLQHIPRRGEKP
jgi:hypothetical protein